MKAIIGVFLVLAAFLSGICMAAGGNMGGASQDGSAAHPWLIEDFEDFQEFCVDPNYWGQGVSTQLECDLNLDPNLPGREVYTHAPIAAATKTLLGHEGTAFSGIFNGNNHTISNLSLNGIDYCGLFGITGSSCYILNLGVINVSVTGSGTYVGGLVGDNYAHVTKCYSTGSVAGNERVGGLVGRTSCFSIYRYSMGNLTNCHSMGVVNSSGGYAGGLAGEIGYCIIANSSSSAVVNCSGNCSGGLAGQNYGKISCCYSIGDVDSSGYDVGGLVGLSYNNGRISNCYSTGSITGAYDVGGLVGDNDPYAVVNNCYSIGSVNGTSLVGGLIGENEGSVFNSYWDVETSAQLTSSGGQPKTTIQMKDSSTFIGWNDGNWTVNSFYDYPRLMWENEIGSVIRTDYPLATYMGTGTVSDPFVLSTSSDVVSMSQRIPDWSGYFILANDIDMTNTTYVPVVDFPGNFDGLSHSINNLTIEPVRDSIFSYLSFVG